MYRSFFLVLFFSPLFFFAQGGNSWWNVVDYNDGYKNYRGGSLGLVVRDNTIHTAYLTRNEDRICYCFSADGGKTWQTEKVEDSTDVMYAALPGLRHPLDSSAWYYKNYQRPFLSYRGEPWRTCLLLDSSGTPHIFFMCMYSCWKAALFKQWIKHAWRENGKWKTEIIQESAAPNYMYAEYAAALDPDGDLSVVFSQEKKGCLIARKENSHWILSAVNTHPAYGIQLQIDNGGYFHCLLGFVDKPCIYAYSVDKGQIWSEEVIPDVTWWEVDMALSSDRTPHIVYKDLHKGTMYGVRKKGEWKFFVLRGDDPVHGARPVILIDNCDHVHVGYFSHYSDTTEADPLYWAFSADDGATWKITEVDEKAFNGSSSGTPGMCLYGNHIYFIYQLQDFSMRLSYKEFLCGTEEDPLHPAPKRRWPK